TMSDPRLWLAARPRPQCGSEPEVVGRAAALDCRGRRREGGDSKRLWSQGKTRPGPPTWRCRAPAVKQEPSTATSLAEKSRTETAEVGHELTPRTTSPRSRAPARPCRSPGPGPRPPG